MGKLDLLRVGVERSTQRDGQREPGRIANLLEGIPLRKGELRTRQLDGYGSGDGQNDRVGLGGRPSLAFSKVEPNPASAAALDTRHTDAEGSLNRVRCSIHEFLGRRAQQTETLSGAIPIVVVKKQHPAHLARIGERRARHQRAHPTLYDRRPEIEPTEIRKAPIVETRGALGSLGIDPIAVASDEARKPQQAERLVNSNARDARNPQQVPRVDDLNPIAMDQRAHHGAWGQEFWEVELADPTQ
jgi:hypothetical protein